MEQPSVCNFRRLVVLIGANSAWVYSVSALDSVKPIDAVVAVAKENYGKLPMAVGTGSDRRRAETMLRHANLLHLFVGLVCAEDVKRHKPYPDTFMKCADIMGIPYECCEVFEDGTPGLQAASSAVMIATDVKQ